MATCRSCGASLAEDARFCSTCGAPQEASPPAPAAEERKLATILFADLVGSTALAHDSDPERVRVLLDRFHETMSEEIERTGGTVEHFAGDGVMAVFGAPTAVEDHAERALHAGLAMHRRLVEQFEDRLAMRVGVNTGEVIVGHVREGSSLVTGDAVNVCARLEAAASPGEVLAGDRTVVATGGAFEFGARRVVDAKGKPDGVACRPVLRALTLARPRGVAGSGRVFVGRESELDVLHSTFRRSAAQGVPHLVTVVGEPGVGKTRLVRELWEDLADEPQVPLRRTGRCLAYGDGITYWPIGEILREHLGVRENDRPEETLRRLEGREILGLALGLDIAGEMHPLDARERLHEAVVAFIDDLAAHRPAVVLVEDIHWAEDDLLDLLERVVTDAHVPVVLLTTARPELFDRRAAWGAGHRNATVMWLDPLQPEDAARMLDELLAGVLPDELRERVVARGGGNPFFLEELVGALVDAGVLERRHGVWGLGMKEADFAMPDTVHAVLAARIDRLPATEKAAIQAASVVGRVFWTSAVVQLMGGDRPDFELLEERDLIRSSRVSTIAGEDEYAIKHALTREVAYASIPKARRGRLHAMLANWLEQGDLGRDERASLLAYHYSEAVKPEDADLVWSDQAHELERLRGRAVHWLRRAGELARGRHEMDEAVALYTRAVELSGDEHDRSLLWREIGQAQALRYDGEAMRGALLRALEGPLDDAERAETYAFLAFQASLRSAMWSIRLNRHLIEEWATTALELASEGSEAQARALLALANVEPTDATDEMVEKAAALAEDLSDPALRSYALGARGQNAFLRRNFGEAAIWSEERLELLSEIDDPDHQCEAYETGLPVAVAMGRFEEARRLAALHQESARHLSAHHRLHSVALELELAEMLGDWHALVTQTDRAVNAVTENLATPCVRNPRSLLICGLAHLCVGAEVRAAELERDAERLGGEGYDSYLSAPRLRLALLRGDREAAAGLVRLPVERSFVWGPAVFATRMDALAALGERSAIEEEAPVLLQAGTVVEPFALRALGLSRGDDELLARADARLAELGLDWHRSQTERLGEGL